MKKAAVKSGIMLFLLTVLLASCSARSDLNNQGIVVLTTIDREQNGQYTVGVGILKPKVMTEESTIGNIWVTSQTSSTIQGAIKELQGRTPVDPVWYSSRVLLLGESAARQGITEITEFLSRSREIRPTVRMAAVEGRAVDILKVEVEASDNIAEQILDILEAQYKESRIFFIEKTDFLTSYYTKGSCVVMPRLAIIEPRPLKEVSESSSPVDRTKSISISGSAIFNNGRLAGWINENESMGLLWLRNKVKGGLISYRQGQERVSAEIIHTRTKMTVSDEGQVPGLYPDIEVKVRLVEYSGDTKLSQHKLNEIGHSFENVVKEQINSLVSRAYFQLKTDPASFGQLIHQKKPQLWNRIKTDWPGNMPGISIKPVIRVDIDNLGLTNDPIEVK